MKQSGESATSSIPSVRIADPFIVFASQTQHQYGNAVEKCVQLKPNTYIVQLQLIVWLPPAACLRLTKHNLRKAWDYAPDCPTSQTQKGKVLPGITKFTVKTQRILLSQYWSVSGRNTSLSASVKADSFSGTWNCDCSPREQKFTSLRRPSGWSIACF